MRRLFILFMCLVAMIAASLSAKAQEVTITLNPGWTWISYLGTEPQNFATALGSFTPEVGDVIKSQWGNATYMANGQWKGSITQFYPGYGYMYKSARAYPVALTLTPQQPATQVVVTTSEPMLITGNSAMGGGEVTVSDGTYILVKGLCWATHENPTTNDDFYQEAESGVGTFSISITGLNISTTYYVRAYAVTPNGTVYGDQKSFTTRDGIPTVTTEITNIEGTYANGGGNITDDGGLAVTARGVCWSTSPNPTLADAHTSNGNGAGSFSSYITGLSMNTTYYVRAYATNSFVTVYGNQLSFTTNEEHVYVDLGLPSGLLWATCNVGADIPEDYGDYFAWGTTQENDAATVNWGAGWRTPTKEEWQELLGNTTNTWTTQNGVNGRLFTATNGNSLFLPAAGGRYEGSLFSVGRLGDYWSSSPYTDYPGVAWYFFFDSGGAIVSSDWYGIYDRSVRAVRSSQN